MLLFEVRITHTSPLCFLTSLITRMSIATNTSTALPNAMMMITSGKLSPVLSKHHLQAASKSLQGISDDFYPMCALVAMLARTSEIIRSMSTKKLNERLGCTVPPKVVLAGHQTG